MILNIDIIIYYNNLYDKLRGSAWENTTQT